MKRLKVVTTINGREAPRGEDVISVFDNALLYAEGLFETFLAIDDRVIFADEHLKRLYRGAQVTGLSIPIEKDRLRLWMVKTVRAHPDRIKKLRLTLTSGEAARWVGVQGKPKIILSASPHQMPTEPFRLHLSEFKIDQHSTFRRIKTISYAIHAAALKRAHNAGCDDALMMNQQDKVAEVTSANIYWVRRNRIYTTPLSAGCLEGVTRHAMLSLARRMDLPIAEKNITVDSLAKSDEVFISSSLKLIIGVSMIKAGRRIYRFPHGPVTDKFEHAFRQLVGLAGC